MVFLILKFVILIDIQLTYSLNAIRSKIECVGDERKWAALETMLSTSSGVVAINKKNGKTRKHGR